jgi:hypothetical protein
VADGAAVVVDDDGRHAVDGAPPTVASRHDPGEEKWEGYGRQMEKREID